MPEDQTCWWGPLATAPDSLARSIAFDEGDLDRVLAMQQARVDLIAEISQAYLKISGGSGVVISADGLVLTNQHVVGVIKDRLQPVRVDDCLWQHDGEDVS